MNYKFCTHHRTSNIIRETKPGRMKLAGHLAHMGEEKKMYKVLVGKPERKGGPLGRQRLWWMGSPSILGRLVGGGGVD
jgi:hypothetical protein